MLLGSDLFLIPDGIYACIEVLYYPFYDFQMKTLIDACVSLSSSCPFAGLLDAKD